MRLVLVIVLVLAAPVFAVEPDEMLPDPALEARAQALGKELRCLVCQSESIEDSHAELARDLRLVVRERLVAGDTDDQVLGFLTDRYGDFVRLRPRFGGATLWLWLAGPALLLIGAGVAFVFISRSRDAGPDRLSDEEEQRIQDLLKDGNR